MKLDRSLPTSVVDGLVGRLAPAADVLPDPGAARPGHVLYGGAHLFDARAPEKVGARASSAMASWGADDAAFASTVGLRDRELATALAARVRAKLARRPIESMCIDFEDGYGPRPDEEEDREAVRAASELAAWTGRAAPPGGPEPPAIGIRIKPLSPEVAARAARTLDLFLTALARHGAAAPRGFTVTLPKVRRPADVALLVDLLAEIEAATGLAPVPIELMIESAEALVDEAGAVAIPALVAAGRGRVVALHLGAYDLTAELGVTAGDQRLDHPFCDLARSLLAVTARRAAVALSDGATTVLPIPPRDASPAEAAAAVHGAWSLHAAAVRRSIDFGIWQGWDLHPAQVPARWGAVFAFFLERRGAVALRLRTFVERATQASRVGQVFDDAATAQGLLAFFRRGLACGALGAEDLAATTLTATELEQSFAAIARARIR